ncbi:MAG TPA: hypothetical protein PLY41_09275, partial [Acetomicrobium sp.]|nr:hypothetical protein [Acetomicrobium sp.]
VAGSNPAGRAMIKNRSYNQQSRRFSLYLQFRPKMHNPFVHEKAVFALPCRRHEAKGSVFMTVIPFRKDVSWQEAVDQFIYFKMAEGRAGQTIKGYRDHLSRFFKCFPDAFDPQKTRKCVFEFMSDQMKPATYNPRHT